MSQHSDETSRRLSEFKERFLLYSMTRATGLSFGSSWTARSALEQLDKTQASVQAFVNEGPVRSEPIRWLRIYGVLQSLFVQADSIQKLLDSFKIEHDLGQKLRGFREVRNSTIGHPVERHQGTLRSSYLTDLEKDGRTEKIRLRRIFHDGRPILEETIDLATLIDSQQQVISKALEMALMFIRNKLGA